jgi:tRNA G18 (ribose-2'-O)-methylase SpoU
MAEHRIDGPDDARVAAYRDLADPDLARSRGLFVAEGRLIVRRVVEDGRYRVQSVLVNRAARRDLAGALASLPSGVPIFICDTPDFLGITGLDIHRGCLALVERPVPAPVDAILAARRTVVVLEGVSNADNVGGVFRNAAAFGAGGVLLSPTCCDPWYRKAIRTSMGAVLRVPFVRADAWPGVLAQVRAAGFRTVALTPGTPSETLEAFVRSPRAESIALIVGTEGAGLSPGVEAAADARVRIPIDDVVDSLNLSVAVGIALYALQNSAAPARARTSTWRGSD